MSQATPTEANPTKVGRIKIYCAYSKLVPLDELKPHPLNANRHPDTQIALFKEIIRGNGIRRPVTVSNRSGHVVAGHGLIAALRALRVKAAPVDFQDFEDEAHELAHLAADNRIAELGEIDDKALAKVIREIESKGGDLDLTGFALSDLDKLLGIETGTDEGGSGGGAVIPETFQVIVECKDEQEQSKVFQKLSVQGMKCSCVTC